MSSRFVPGRRLPWLVGAALPLGALPGGLVATLVWDTVAVGAALWDGRRALLRAPTFERVFSGRWVVGQVATYRLRVVNRSDVPVHLQIAEALPSTFELVEATWEQSLPAGARRDIEVKVIPRERGEAAFGPLEVRVEGSLGLGAQVVRAADPVTVRVAPDVLGRARGAVGRIPDLRALGVRQVRRVGGGGDFDRLRDYVQGDPPREVDWKASAKRQRPITRLLREEKSQQIIIAIDLGRLMAIRSGDGASKLDRALEAALLLAWVALRNGDRVGAIFFASGVEEFIPPGRGPHQYRSMLDAATRVTAKDVAVDFRTVFEFVKVRVPRRSLVIVFSDLLDDTHATVLAEHLARVRSKHVAVCVTMEDRETEDAARARAANVAQVYRRAAAADLTFERDLVKARLRSGGVALVEAPAGGIAVQAVQKYLEVKARGLL